VSILELPSQRQPAISDLAESGRILLLSCYELGHQPLNLALPLAYLRRAGYAPATVDTSVETLEDATIARAGLVAISVPMHTALRLGVAIARRVRRINPEARVCFFGLPTTCCASTATTPSAAKSNGRCSTSCGRWRPATPARSPASVTPPPAPRRRSSDSTSRHLNAGDCLSLGITRI
jgi:hypothetical protein